MHYQQEQPRFCAPACAEMVLSSLGVSESIMPDQYTLNSAVVVVPGPIRIGNPLGLASALEQYTPRRGRFEPIMAGMPSTASGNIVDALYELGAAVPVIVHCCKHYVVVNGVDTNVQPAPGIPYQIEAFWYHDPSDAQTSLLAPPNDPEQHVTYQDWIRTWLTGCDKFSKPFVIVTGPVSAAVGDFLPESFGQSNSPQHLIDLAAASKSARRGLKRYGLERYGLTKKGRYEWGIPRLVQRIDRVDEFYYLVPLRRDDGLFTVVRVDALAGAYLGAQFGRAEYRYVDRGQMTQQLADACIEWDDGSSRLRLGTYDVHPTLVWRPSPTSPSPYHPLYQINVGGTTVYADCDARIYFEL